MSPIRLEKRVPEKNQYWVYRLLLAPTLFGECAHSSASGDESASQARCPLIYSRQ
jgi:hypothetical protein